MLLCCCLALCLVTGMVQAQQNLQVKLKGNETLIKTNPDAAFVQIKQLLNESLKNKDSLAVAICYQQIGELFYYQAAYLQALDNFFKADKLFRNRNDQLNVAGNLNKIGETYYYNKQYNQALKIFLQAHGIYKKLNNHLGIAQTYGYIGQSYEKTNAYASALKYQQLALAEFKKVNDKTGIAKIYENLGSLHEDKLKLDSAMKYFKLALDLNEENNNSVAQTEVINNIGDVFRKSGRYRESLVYTRRAAQLGRQLNDKYQLASAYRDLSKSFDLMKMPDSAYHYSELGRNIVMEIYSQENEKQLTLLQTLFEIEQKDNAIDRFESEQKISRVLAIGGIIIVGLAGLLAASIISRQRLKIRNEQRLNEQNNRLYETQRQAMEVDIFNKQLKEENLRGELELKSKELTSHTLHLIQKNQLLEELKNKLNTIVKDDKRDQRKELKQLLNLITLNNNQDKNWEDFRIVFERVHEHFFDSVKKHSTSLSPADLRLLALLKMNLGSGDISTMLGISQDSLRISRYRLRKKLNLAEGESLTAFIQGL